MNPLFNIHEEDRENKEISKKVLATSSHRKKEKQLQVLFFNSNFLGISFVSDSFHRTFYDQGINFVGGFYFYVQHTKKKLLSIE